MEHLQRVWHASRERLPFRTPGSVPHCGTCLCSNCWEQIPHTCHVFTRLFTSITPWYFLDFACHDIITISESWLDSSIENNDIAIPNFQPPALPWYKQTWGGVAVYIKNNIPFNERADLYIPNLEAIGIEENLGNKKVLICTFNIHPRFDNWNIVELSIEQTIHISSNIILLGNFNENTSMLDLSKCRNITKYHEQLQSESTH